MTLDDLRNEHIPLIIIDTVDGEEPTYEVVDHPEGCMGQSITNATKVPGRLRIVLGEETLYDSGDYEKDASGMTVKVRGNTSATYFAKKPYKIKLQKKADLLCRGEDAVYKDKEWVLITNNGYLSHHLVGLTVTRLMGFSWAPAAQLVNVVMNNKYRGIYTLAESVKRNPSCRIDVDEDTGYILEYDAYFWNEDVSFPTTLRSDYGYTFKYPDSDDVTQQQIDYIYGVLQVMEASLSDGTYEEYIDVVSFARWLLTHDLLGDGDSGGTNKFLSKYDDSAQSKIKLETCWDFDAIEQQDDDYSLIHSTSGYYFSRLFNSSNDAFVREYKTLWETLSTPVVADIIGWIDDLASSALPAAIDSYSAIDQAVSYLYYPSFSEELATHRAWFLQRQQWLNDNIPLIIDTGIADMPSIEQVKTSHRYNLSGQQVSETYKGIVIVDGKKVLQR